MKQMMILAFVGMMAFTQSCISVKTGSDHPTEVQNNNETTTMTTFDKVVSAGAMQVMYEPGPAYTVRVEAPDEQFDKLVIYVERNHLCIETKKGIHFQSSMKDVIVHVTSPSIKLVSQAGSGEILIDKLIETDNMTMNLTGSGSIKFADLICSKLDVELTGSGSIILDKVDTNSVETEVTGSGSVTYYQIEAQKAKSEVTGSGLIKLNGKVAKHDKQCTGSGSIIAHLVE